MAPWGSIHRRPVHPPTPSAASGPPSVPGPGAATQSSPRPPFIFHDPCVFPHSPRPWISWSSYPPYWDTSIQTSRAMYIHQRLGDVRSVRFQWCRTEVFGAISAAATRGEPSQRRPSPQRSASCWSDQSPMWRDRGSGAWMQKEARPRRTSHAAQSTSRTTLGRRGGHSPSRLRHSRTRDRRHSRNHSHSRRHCRSILRRRHSRNRSPAPATP